VSFFCGPRAGEAASRSRSGTKRRNFRGAEFKLTSSESGRRFSHNERVTSRVAALLLSALVAGTPEAPPAASRPGLGLAIEFEKTPAPGAGGGASEGIRRAGAGFFVPGGSWAKAGPPPREDGLAGRRTTARVLPH